MIGIKGIAKKPITDATASSNDVIAGKVFYNNDGRIVGDLGKDSILYKRSIIIPAATYTSKSSSIKINRRTGILQDITLYAYATPLSVYDYTYNITSDSMTTGYHYHGSDKLEVILQEGSFQDNSYEPIGFSWTDKNGNRRKIFYDDNVSDSYHLYKVWIDNIDNTASYMDSDYNDYGGEEMFLLYVSCDCYQVSSIIQSSSFNISKCVLPKDFYIDLYFVKRS